MKKTVVTGLLALLVLSAGFRTKAPGSFLVPDGWPRPEHNFRKQPLDNRKVQLGRVLFYDPVLSRDSTTSCASCHSPYTAFTHTDHNLSHGIMGRIGTRNSPALINLAWSRSFMWDGSVAHLEEQADKPISNPLEMDESMAGVVHKLQRTQRYPAFFYGAFKDSVVTKQSVSEALAQFMLILVSADARYDKVKRGEEQFTEQEANGYALFQKNCGSCHTEPLFTNLGFENNGLPIDTALKDAGRMKVTGRERDEQKFKVPTLRNIEFSSPYMHDGRFKKLGEVFTHYTSGIKQGPTLSKQLKGPIVLSSREKVDLTAFLLTLTDHRFLSNPDFSFPKNILSNR